MNKDDEDLERIRSELSSRVKVLDKNYDYWTFCDWFVAIIMSPLFLFVTVLPIIDYMEYRDYPSPYPSGYGDVFGTLEIVYPFGALVVVVLVFVLSNPKRRVMKNLAHVERLINNNKRASQHPKINTTDINSKIGTRE